MASRRHVRILPHGHYRIAYILRDDGTVDILGIFHAALYITRYELPLHAPALLPYELASIARNKTLREPGRRDVFTLTLTNVLGMNITFASVDALAILALALETGLTPYDASYLHLAMTLNLPLATFDTRLRAAAGGGVTVL